MKIGAITIIAIIFINCNFKPKNPEDAFRKKHLFFSADSTYNIKLGSTIAFGYSETQGIDRGRFPAPSYSRDVDTAFFTFVHEESFYPEGCNGCAKTYYSIFKAVKKGTTNITEIKTMYMQDVKQLPPQKDTTIVVGQYIVNIR